MNKLNQKGQTAGAWGVMVGAFFFIIIVLLVGYLISSSTGDVADLNKNQVAFSQKYCKDVPTYLNKDGKLDWDSHLISEQSDLICIQKYASQSRLDTCKSETNCKKDNYHVYQTKDYFTDGRQFCCVYKIDGKTTTDTTTDAKNTAGTTTSQGSCDNRVFLTPGQSCTCNGQEFTCEGTTPLKCGTHTIQCRSA